MGALTIPQVWRVLGYSRQSFYKLINSGQLNALKKYWEHKYPEQVEDHLTLCGNNRRQLEELRAALKLAEKRKWIETAPHVELPPKSQPRDKFLTYVQEQM